MSKKIIQEYLDTSQASFLSAQADINAQMMVQDRIGRQRLQVVMDRLSVLIDMGNKARTALGKIDE